MSKNAINWFEVPVKDFDRAVKFYESVFATGPFQKFEGGEARMAFFPSDQTSGVGGAISTDPHNTPGPNGVRIYLAAEGQIDAMCGRLSAAGGKLITPKMSIGAHGFIALIQDTEGNVVGLHSMAA